MTISVVVLNWNGWVDTLECLESLFRIDTVPIRVILCDNASTDGSLARVEQWAQGHQAANCGNSALANLSTPPVLKPIPYTRLERAQAESGRTLARERLILIQNGANLGFAAGNNVGLRYALRYTDCNYFFLLNNDTVVDPAACAALIDCLQNWPGVGLCGSVIRSYYDPEKVQVCGGRLLDRWTGRTRKTLPNGSATRIDYVEGCAMMATRTFVERVGLLSESYFLYFEELDWAMRARGKLALAVCDQSVIFHKEGASIGSHADRKQRSLTSERYLTRSRVLFMRQFFPVAIPMVLASLLLAAVYHLLRGDVTRARLIVVWSLKGLFAKTS